MRRYTIHKIHLSLFIILGSFPGFAQITLDTSDYINFERDVYAVHYNTKNHLSQNTITSMNVDQDGYLWFFTESELSRFDGQNFTSDYTALRSKQLYKYPDGSLFIPGRLNLATQNGGIIPDSIGGKNKILFSNRGLYIMRDSTWTTAQIKSIPKHCKFIRTKSGDCYAYSHKGIFYRTKSGWDTLQKTNLIRGHNVFAGDSGFYFIDNNRHLWEYRRGRFKTRYLLSQFSENVSALWNYSPHAAYFYDNQSLYRFQEKNGHPVLKLWIRGVDIIGLKRVLELKETDSSNVFFLGTTTNGFYYCRKKRLSSKGLSLDRNKPNVVYAHVELHADSVLTGLGTIISKDSAYSILSSGNISNRHLFKDSKGRIWTDFKHNGSSSLGYYETQPDLNMEKVEVSRTILRVVEDKFGVIWAFREGILFRFNENQKKFQRADTLSTTSGMGFLMYNPYTHAIGFLVNLNFWFMI